MEFVRAQLNREHPRRDLVQEEVWLAAGI